MEIIQYESKHRDSWDKFVLEESFNGTFLQARRFLEYHPDGRFSDASLLILSKNNIIGVCPANRLEKEGEIIFSSHSGSTFGGIVLCQKYYTAEHVLEILQALEDYLEAHGYTQIILKQTPDIMSLLPGPLFEFCYQYRHYQQVMELDTYIDFSNYKPDLLANFKQGKRTDVHNCIKSGFALKELQSPEEIKNFYTLLESTLQKYHCAPVHTVAELLELKYERLQNQMDFWGIYLDDELIAASMMFYFEKTKCAHTQYLAASRDYNKLSPMTYLCYEMIRLSRERGFRYLSWGISTENLGSYINLGLQKSKEAYGSKCSVNRTFLKHL